METPSSEELRHGVDLLVVDDDLATCAFVQQYAQRHGIGTECATSTIAAREAVIKHKPRVALVGLGIAQEHDFAFARWLKAYHPAVAIVISADAHALASLPVEVLGSGYDYLTKPLDASIMLTVVKRQLTRQTDMAPSTRMS